ncbi:Gfo/Idh/MocA family protein [Litoreibacter roseus]|uniref:Dehydrogenase n=1 Tax=Litoreibacter roseus TaxID=2601869 RepID=A0A6N6JGL5_9RHOB|nr:Gfo/Idh/MocA family oxidoreductase [Litoreibacter roseus]GFE65483.1 dehydrogenase [Litoreibacter roseus]
MKVALIGVGMVAETHAAALRASETVTLHGVLGRDSARAKAFANVQGAKLYSSIQAVADDPSIDFAILATPPNARLDLVRTLIAGRKPILMEKPLERSLIAARHVVDVCARAHVPLGIVFQHRVRDSAQRLKQMVDAGALGQIAAVDIHVPWWRPQSYYDAPGRGTLDQDGGGVLITQAIHTLDLALHLAGPVTKVQAFARTTSLHKTEVEDFVSAGFDFASGAVGALTATTANYPGGTERIVLHGTEGSACLEGPKLNVDWRDGRQDSFGADEGSGGGADPMAFTHEWHQSVIEDFAASLKDQRAPMAPGRDALKVHTLIDAMIRSSDQGRMVEIADA